MGFQLNIKDRNTVELARAMSRKSGKSVTQTIRDALEQADDARNRDTAARTAEILATLRSIPGDRPPDSAGRTSREIVQQFHAAEWQEQYGSDS